MEKKIQFFLAKYPEFTCEKFENKYLLKGQVYLNHEFNGVQLINNYFVDISIDTDSLILGPTIKETSNKIDKKYSHLNDDKSLCLATYPELFNFFDNLTDDILVRWIDSFVVPYFYSYEFFQKYKFFPFGDRSHGALGILEYYQDYFKTEKIDQTFNLIKYIILTKKIRGHIQCPCNSGKRIRNCHIKEILNIMDNPKERSLLLFFCETYLKEKKNNV